jgi:hypothetical protein
MALLACESEGSKQTWSGISTHPHASVTVASTSTMYCSRQESVVGVLGLDIQICTRVLLRVDRWQFCPPGGVHTHPWVFRLTRGDCEFCPGVGIVA